MHPSSSAKCKTEKESWTEGNFEDFEIHVKKKIIKLFSNPVSDFLNVNRTTYSHDATTFEL